jgi:hypothetical protein
MLELAVLGISGFVVGVAVCALLWTAFTAPLSPRDIVHNPIFWCFAILSGLVVAGAFYFATRMS